MVQIIHWPHKLLRPASTLVSPVAFSRSGGRSLGGIEPTTRTDRGFWRITLSDVSLWSPAMRRTWQAMRVMAAGRPGLFAVPVWSFDSAPYASGQREPIVTVPHDDETPFDDGSEYSQGAIDIQMAAFAPMGSTVVTLKVIKGSSVVGIRFSYQHALYETGSLIEELGDDTYRVAISTNIRAPIPAGASLEVDHPTCLSNLTEDRGMDLGLSASQIDSATVEFVEATGYWNDVALGLEE